MCRIAETAMCGVVDEPAQGASEVGMPVRRPKPVLVSESTAIKVCELVSAVVVPVPGVFRIDPVGVDSAPRVVDPLRTGCVSVSTG